MSGDPDGPSDPKPVKVEVVSSSAPPSVVVPIAQIRPAGSFTVVLRKKIMVAIVTGAFVLANDRFKLGISTEAITQLVALVAAFLVGQGIADFGKGKVTEENST